MLDNNDLRITILRDKQVGMQLTYVETGVRIEHLPSGLVVEVPNTVCKSQHKNSRLALCMLETALMLQGYFS